MAALSEDDIYRTSTQYRLWAFNPESLASSRSTTNSLAADRVRAAMRCVREQKVADDGSNTESGDAAMVDCLTVDEEQKLVGFYCIKAMQLADFCDFPTNVKATAVQYLKRFYLSNSPMTYHPKEIMPSALFLSTKTENHYTSLRSFVSKLKKTTAEDVIAPEFLLSQGLRFTFDVRHPQRGLEGGFMELVGWAKGQQGATLQREMMGIDPSNESGKRAKNSEDLVHRIQIAHGKAKETLKTSALLTDAYFHYTPSQIWLSAFMLADEPLTVFYFNKKLAANPILTAKLAHTLRSCSDLLHASPSADPGEAEMKELMKIDKQLYKCRNPEMMDLVSINKAQKRDSNGRGKDALDEKIIKRRKLEKERFEMEADDIFGPALNGKDGG
ncbi:MAG: hypothetical protein Q9217_001906 [Psora testacea]